MIRYVEILQEAELERALGLAAPLAGDLRVLGLVALDDGRRGALAIGSYGRFFAVVDGAALPLPTKAAIDAYGRAILRSKRRTDGEPDQGSSTVAS